MNKQRIKELGVNIYILLLILLNCSTFIIGVSNEGVLLTCLGLALSCIISLLLIIKNNKVIKIRALRLGIFIVLPIFFMIFLNKDFNLNNFFEIVVVFVGLICVSVFDEQKFSYGFYSAMKFLMLFSLLAYFAGIIFPSIIKSFPIIRNSQGVSFRYLIFTVLPDNQLGRISLRNYGCFREPGVYVIYIIFSYCIGKKYSLIKRFDVVVFFITIISTLSTSGYLIAILVVLSMIMEKKNFKTWIFISSFIIAMTIFLYNYTDLLKLDGPVLSKLINGGGSADARFGSIQQNFELIRNYPFIGSGWSAANKLFLSSNLNHHNTNTILYYFSYYGIVIGVLYSFGLYKFFSFMRQSILSIFIMFILVLTLSTERLNFDLIVICFILYGLLNFKRFSRGKKYESVMANK